MLFVGAVLLAVFVLPDAWDLPVVALGAILEIAETVVGIRLSRRGAPKVGPETLVGQEAEVVVSCRPAGRVKLRGEHWLARCEDGAEVGERVRVRGRDGLTLVVEQVHQARAHVVLQ